MPFEPRDLEAFVRGLPFATDPAPLLAFVRESNAIQQLAGSDLAVALASQDAITRAREILPQIAAVCRRPKVHLDGDGDVVLSWDTVNEATLLGIASDGLFLTQRRGRDIVTSESWDSEGGTLPSALLGYLSAIR